jgi:hypothetical protein
MHNSAQKIHSGFYPSTPRTQEVSVADSTRRYFFGQLKTDGSPESNSFNNHWLGKKTLGIEVTDPALAPRCGLGNIDPQHVVGGGKSSAVERALEWPLPADGSNIVTIRLDKDSLSTMAVFLLGSEGRDHKIDKLLLNWIGALDNAPFRQVRDTHPELYDMFKGARHTDAINVIAKGHGNEPLAARVKAVANILTGEMPASELAALVAQFDRWRENRSYASETFEPVKFCGNVALYREPRRYDDVRSYANPRHAVVVINDPERYTSQGGLQDRWCVVRQEEPVKVFDRAGFEVAINAAEAAARGLTQAECIKQSLVWGGTKNLVVSPQGAARGTKLTECQILELARRHLESGIVT